MQISTVRIEEYSSALLSLLSSMSSSSTSRAAWGNDPVSRTKPRRSVPATTAAAAAASPSFSAITTKKPAAAAAEAPIAVAVAQPKPIQRFSQYGARFKGKSKRGSGVASPTKSPLGLSTRGFFSLGGGGSAVATLDKGSGRGEGAINGNGREAGGARHARRGSARELQRTKPSPQQRVPPRSLPLAGPAALAATINSTLTVTTGRAAGETVSTSESSNTNSSGNGGGCGGGRGSAFEVGNGSGTEADSPTFSDTWAWEHPETPPASMPNLHQSSGSEDRSGSEDDEGFGLALHVDADYEDFVMQKRSASASVAVRYRSAPASAPGGGTLGVSGSSATPRPSAKGVEGFRSAPAAEVVPLSSPPPQHKLLPPRFPRSTSVGETGAPLVQPSTAPPPLPARRLVVDAEAPAAAPARSPPRRRPVSVRTPRAPKSKEDDELRPFFRDPRLETTLVRKSE